MQQLAIDIMSDNNIDIMSDNNIDIMSGDVEDMAHRERNWD
jgi:hypothetical protein